VEAFRPATHMVAGYDVARRDAVGSRGMVGCSLYGKAECRARVNGRSAGWARTNGGFMASTRDFWGCRQSVVDLMVTAVANIACDNAWDELERGG
jgi:hypothetical protein